MNALLPIGRSVKLIYLYGGVLYLIFRRLYHQIPNPRWGMVANIQSLAVIWGWDTRVWILNLNRRGLLPLEQEGQMGVNDLF